MSKKIIKMSEEQLAIYELGHESIDLIIIDKKPIGYWSDTILFSEISTTIDDYLSRRGFANHVNEGFSCCGFDSVEELLLELESFNVSLSLEEKEIVRKFFD